MENDQNGWSIGVTGELPQAPRGYTGTVPSFMIPLTMTFEDGKLVDIYFDDPFRVIVRPYDMGLVDTAVIYKRLYKNGVYGEWDKAYLKEMFDEGWDD